ncbi:sigma-70 family RNA polymerase sigma factor [Brevundimonas sp. A19_0]|uniref:RNA polymerase sigma factor n=1 Tax=Brevundimonas sp. A19_0 TaxID=2821087 RepID=UPI001AD961C2|nr:sigma-70 family RNA polymerase sigma factor [Brevundimonas sp. A19_0]MBO9501584.1 sigma-70 family RNA polymerase sigma factor [Brevundimonas sp. A19_0]
MTRSGLSDRHDVELAALAAASDRAAFGELVRRHSSSVRALLRRMGAQPALADDIAQDAFIVAFERSAEFRGEGTFSAWVRRIAARLYLKRRDREARYVSEDAAGDEAVSVDPLGRFDLDAALQTLSEVERLCVSLGHGAGMTHPEIATALNLPLGTVKSHVKRGLDKLRQILDPGMGESGGASHVSG